MYPSAWYILSHSILFSNWQGASIYSPACLKQVLLGPHEMWEGLLFLLAPVDGSMDSRPVSSKPRKKQTVVSFSQRDREVNQMASFTLTESVPLYLCKQFSAHLQLLHDPPWGLPRRQGGQRWWTEQAHGASHQTCKHWPSLLGRGNGIRKLVTYWDFFFKPPFPLLNISD